MNLYLAKGAHKVWIVYDDKRILTYIHVGEIEKSEMAAKAQQVLN